MASDESKPASRVLGGSLKVGDKLDVFWSEFGDTITALRPYDGPFPEFRPNGAVIVSFASLSSELVIECDETFSLAP